DDDPLSNRGAGLDPARSSAAGRRRGFACTRTRSCSRGRRDCVRTARGRVADRPISGSSGCTPSGGTTAGFGDSCGQTAGESLCRGVRPRTEPAASPLLMPLQPPDLSRPSGEDETYGPPGFAHGDLAEFSLFARSGMVIVDARGEIDLSNAAE